MSEEQIKTTCELMKNNGLWNFQWSPMSNGNIVAIYDEKLYFIRANGISGEPLILERTTPFELENPDF